MFNHKHDPSMKTPVVYEIAGNLRCLLVEDGQKISIGRAAECDVQINGEAVHDVEATAQFVNDCHSVVISSKDGHASHELPLPWTLPLAGFDLALYRPSSPAKGSRASTVREITLQGLVPDKIRLVLKPDQPLLLGSSTECDAVIASADCPAVQLALWAAADNKVVVQVLDNSSVVDWLGRADAVEAEMELPAGLSLGGKMILIGNGAESYSTQTSVAELTPADPRTLAKAKPPLVVAEEFYINKNSQQHGPFSEEEVRRSVRQGTYSANDLAWKEGAEDWVPLNKLIRISGPPRILPPTAGKTQNNSTLAPQIVVSTNMVAPETASPRGVIIASWVLIGLLCGGAFIPGLGFGTWALVWPFMLTTFILGIIALARRATVQGVMILLATIVVVPVVILVVPIISTIGATAAAGTALAVSSSEAVKKTIADELTKVSGVDDTKVLHTVGEAVTHRDVTVILNSVTLNAGVLTANFTVRNDGSKIVRSNFINFSAKDAEGQQLERTVLMTDNVLSDAEPKNLSKGNLQWKASKDGVFRIYFSPEILSGTKLVWQVDVKESVRAQPQQLMNDKAVGTSDAGPPAKIGESFKLGGFSYTITSVKSGPSVNSAAARNQIEEIVSLSDDMNIAMAKAYGLQKPSARNIAPDGSSFLAIRYVIQNESDEVKIVTTKDFKLLDSKKRTFSTSSEATAELAITQGINFLLAELQPGVRHEGAQVFLMPDDALNESLILIVPEKGLLGTGAKKVRIGSALIKAKPQERGVGSSTITAAPAGQIAQISKSIPLINSLGMKFVPAGTPGVLFSVWETRVQDFAAFVEETGYDAITNSANGIPPKHWKKGQSGKRWEVRGKTHDSRARRPGSTRSFV